MFAAIQSARVARSRFAVGAVVAPRRAYHEKVISHYERPRNVSLCEPLERLNLC